MIHARGVGTASPFSTRAASDESRASSAILATLGINRSY